MANREAVTVHDGNDVLTSRVITSPYARAYREVLALLVNPSVASSAALRADALDGSIQTVWQSEGRGLAAQKNPGVFLSAPDWTLRLVSRAITLAVKARGECRVKTRPPSRPDRPRRHFPS
jgi:hypothetical protein